MQFTGRERAFTWLRQVTTALAGGLVWAILAARLPDAEGQLPAATAEEEPDDGQPEYERQPLSVAPQPIPFQPAPEQHQPGPELEAPVPERIRPAPTPVAVPDPEPVAADGNVASPAARARKDYHDRRAYSPRRDEARALVERIAELEQAGDTAEAEQLAAQLSDL